MKIAIKNLFGLMAVGLMAIAGWLPSAAHAQVSSPQVANGGTFNVAVGELLADTLLPTGLTFSAPGNPVLTLVSVPPLPANITFDAVNNRLFGTPIGGVGNYAITVSAPGNADLNFTLVVSNPANAVTGPSPTTAGNIAATVDGTCQYTYNQFIGPPPGPMGGLVPTTVPLPPPGNTWFFPQGMFDLRVEGCALGGVVATFVITYPQALPAGTVYWVFGPEPANPMPHWFQLPPANVVIAGNTVTLTIQDGSSSQGDNDGSADGTIRNLGGPASLLALPELTKAFAPTTITVGGVTTLTFTVTHGAGDPTQTFSFTDNLPVGLVIATNPNVGGTCANVPAAVTAAAGTGTITVTNAQITALQATCTISVDVTTAPMPTVGACPQAANTNGLVNVIVDPDELTNNVTDQCVTVTLLALPTFTKAFAPTTIAVGGVTTLTFTVAHDAGNPTQTFSFIDDLPAGLVIAANPNVGGTCANVPAGVTAVAGTTGISVINAQITALQTTCTISVDVTTAPMPTVGACPQAANTNGAGNIIGFVGIGNNVTDQCVTVTLLALPTLTKAFAPTTIAVGGVTTLTFTVAHDAGNPTQTFSFTDNLPAGLVIAANPNVGGTCANVPAGVTAAAGAATITVANVQITALQTTCTISVDVTTAPMPTVGACPQAANTNGAGNIGFIDLITNNVTDQCVTVTLLALPTFTKAFAPTTIAVGGVTTLTFTVAHDAGNPTQTFSFTDNLPAGLVIAANPNVGGTCANVPAAVAAAAGTTTITVTNAQITALQTTCTISVNVTTAPMPTVGVCPQAANTNGAGNIIGFVGIGNNVTDQCVTVTLTPGMPTIPTLSEWTLILLGFLVVGSGVFYVRRKQVFVFRRVCLID